MAWTVTVLREAGAVAHIRATWNEGLVDEFSFGRTLDATEGGNALRDFKSDALAAKTKAEQSTTAKATLATRIEGLLNG